jgi:hypothetical protein
MAIITHAISSAALVIYTQGFKNRGIRYANYQSKLHQEWREISLYAPVSRGKWAIKANGLFYGELQVGFQNTCLRRILIL